MRNKLELFENFQSWRRCSRIGSEAYNLESFSIYDGFVDLLTIILSMFGVHFLIDDLCLAIAEF